MKDRGALGYLNPLRQPSASVRSRAVGLNTNGGGYFPSSFTTTDTSTWQTVASGIIPTSQSSGLLEFNGNLHVSHSVTGALFALAIYVYPYVDGSSGALYFNPYIVGQLSVIAGNVWQANPIIGVMALSNGQVPIPAGNHLYVFACRNYTAGTLYVAQYPYDFLLWKVIGS